MLKLTYPERRDGRWPRRLAAQRRECRAETGGGRATAPGSGEMGV